MQERSTGLARDNLISFLDFVAEKGLMKSKTATSYKKACNVILKILDEAEVADLSKIDLDAVFQRHRNLAAGKVKPATLRSYEERTRAAVNNFLEYVKDPTTWKPGIKQRPSRVAKKPSITRKSTAGKIAGKPELPMEQEGTLRQPPIYMNFQIHISPEASPEQIDQIFASMRRHLYSKQNG